MIMKIVLPTAVASRHILESSEAMSLVLASNPTKLRTRCLSIISFRYFRVGYVILDPSACITSADSTIKGSAQ